MKTKTAMTAILQSRSERDDKANQEHSPLPWTLYDGSDSYTFTIKSAWTPTHRPGEAEGYGDYRGLTICEIEHQGESAPVVTKRQAKANAEYVVRACNNAEKLAEALISAEDSLETLAIAAKAGGYENAYRQAKQTAYIALGALADWQKGAQQ